MPDYLSLLAPSSNRVYAADAPRLAAAEAQDLLGALGARVEPPESVEVAGVDYLRVRTAEPLDEVGLRGLGAASGTFALFREAGGGLLEPLTVQRPQHYPDDLLTIQKYPGRTNEQWTRLLLNVTAAATRHPQRLLDGTMTVLDPMCGRGTTLNLALTYGLDCTGVDLDKRDLENYERFLKTWLRQHRYKHTVDVGSLRTSGTSRGRRMQVVVAPTKEEFKTGDVQRLDYLCTDTRSLHGLLGKGQFDVVVTDTPYGVEHGSHGDRLARDPLGVLEAAMPGWVRTLRTGGAVGLSYNRHVAPPDALGELLQRNGLEIVGDIGDDRYRHRVDASIDRDLIVARKVG